MVYAVIDTNVLVSAILSIHPDSATVIIRDKIIDGLIIPIYNADIIEEYRNVQTQISLPGWTGRCRLDVILQKGFSLERTKTEEVFIDPKDVVFYEIALSKEGSYVVTGNTKHFPVSPIVVTPAEMLRILEA